MNNSFILANKVKILILRTLILSLLLSSCKKIDNWLDVKRSKNDAQPITIDDLQATIDAYSVVNQNFPIIGLLGTDNVSIRDNNVASLSIVERNSYIFAKDIYQSGTSSDFQTSYLRIGVVNIVLDGLEKINRSSNEVNYDNVKGQALFLRSLTYYNLAQLFCKPYDPNTVASDLGLQLKLTSDPNERAQRSTLKQSYERILTDLQLSVDLLPAVSAYGTRASKCAAYSLLAKVYLTMGDYTNASKYADMALKINSNILDYNSTLIQPNSSYRFPVYKNINGNPEIIFYGAAITYASIWPLSGFSNVDLDLYAQYDDNDLRKKLYFKNQTANDVRFVGSYTGTINNFTGIATDEILLIRAECFARSGNISSAMNDLNTLMFKRWNKSVSFPPMTANTADEALIKILSERRKELPFTGLCRWEDLRRLNKDPRFAKTVTHIVNNVRYELLPNSDRYTYPIPDNEIQLSGIPQNQR